MVTGMHIPVCGKGLWKSLWRMWKTCGFQQVFPLLTHFWRVHKGVHIGAVPVITQALCYRGKERDSRGIWSKKLGSFVKAGVKTGELTGVPAKYLVKTHKKQDGMF